MWPEQSNLFAVAVVNVKQGQESIHSPLKDQPSSSSVCIRRRATSQAKKFLSMQRSTQCKLSKNNLKATKKERGRSDMARRRRGRGACRGRPRFIMRSDGGSTLIRWLYQQLDHIAKAHGYQYEGAEQIVPSWSTPSSLAVVMNEALDETTSAKSCARRRMTQSMLDAHGSQAAPSGRVLCR